ncbi:molybdopterin guanine dinucleotide synthesis [Lutimaribacter sp. EGI FJ00015]|uniref:Molybdopterin guanine dinucleotide synthesis n=1 Tax=Lutimaribacter degradans TaxID=2945989 RepID=A0ACC5ZXL3_9RHOB|nr:molybdopterin guanine dinucleotide synthesis [Lutimaribacter sp. EGI FJ00013]MCM2563077.1 molybdopterin guanine dinucleotide synthesis [Lutimaribacter sp. EGI FJ00013]MCO0614256.1 molybdopterin guanine dinucleotide synthesis [Lutimaribacter sp. EGI FJ00015]MCO0637066.1 molybdopterin guanine dinucleotide synthesis [Lutimaribacter sp. EGI FJ00014]
MFDSFVMVDWSAAGAPRTGADSIWLAVLRDGGLNQHNPPTRAEAEDALRHLLLDEQAAGRRVLAGFDFAFGYPPGLSARLGAAGWRSVWSALAARIVDGAKNANNRFDVGGALNALFDAPGPFWGNGLQRDIPGLPRKKPGGWGTALPENRRICDALAPGAQEVWKLSGAGSVGGQALTGIAMLERLRHATGAAVWPFEWPGTSGIVLAEVFPSLWPLTVPVGQIRDAEQVRQTAERLAAWDGTGHLLAALEVPLAQPARVCQDEGWILGVSPT